MEWRGRLVRLLFPGVTVERKRGTEELLVHRNHLTGEWSDGRTTPSRGTGHGSGLVAPRLSERSVYCAKKMAFRCLCGGIWCVLEQQRNFKTAESTDTGPCLVNVRAPLPKCTQRLGTAAFVELM